MGEREIPESIRIIGIWYDGSSYTVAGAPQTQREGRNLPDGDMYQGMGDSLEEAIQAVRDEMRQHIFNGMEE